MTVTGKLLPKKPVPRRKRLANPSSRRSISRCKKTGGLVILHGNIAPGRLRGQDQRT